MSSYDENTTPAVCERCLGDNPYVEMTRERNGAQCKICTRPFTVFRWSIQKGGEFKKTAICLTCARTKNCCQCCMLDLSLGIDLNTRDQLLKMAGVKDGEYSKDVVHNAKNEISRIYNADQLDRKFSREEIKDNSEKAKDVLGKITKLVESGSGKGETTKKSKNKVRGADDEKITKEMLVKLLKTLPFNGNLSHLPKNERIKSFFLFGVGDETPNYLIEEFFKDLVKDSTDRSERRMVNAVFVNSKGRFGFIEFSSRSIAEMAASKLNESKSEKIDNKPKLVVIDRTSVRVCWAGKVITSGSDYSNSELHRIAQVVRKQMIKLAGGGGESTKRINEESAAITRKKAKVVHDYKALQADYEL
ncbi:hypothetical protein FOA43_002850 [Brettanomyces nanus]|uniref:Pre-mRNA-splicing factor SLT11 n=1 Tax=Eeniella nana TaxID=13502 RepID=A0A875S562_EENNA|nr:uncharacterized protein FOA43_002850 [Brettanomyces nanus]QPG75495.1 hypothetical protein FOA43_002850 [Brettanomyces nanus]